MQHLTQEQIADFPGPQNMGDYAGVVRATPQELVQNCSFVRQITEEIGDGVQQVPSKRMPERHGDCNIKGLDKYNMPRSGDVMVPALHMVVPVPQIFEEIVERPEILERIIERFGLSISWDRGRGGG